MGRYQIHIPPIDCGPAGIPSVFCSPDAAVWQSLTWGRWGSGGQYDARHMFVDDWRLEHLWRKQGEGLAKVICQGIVTAPDFTIEQNFPAPLVQYQVFRSRILAAYWIAQGVIVVPVLQWGSPSTFDLCAAGIRPSSVVAVRGPQKGTETAWLQGVKYMIATLCPSLILHFGRRAEYADNVLYFPLRS